MKILLYFIPIWGMILYISYDAAVSTSLVQIVNLDHSTKDNTGYWTSIFFISSMAASIVSLSLQGFFSDTYGYKIMLGFIFSSAAIGSIIQIWNPENIIFLCFGRLMFGFANPSVVIQAYYYSIADDNKSIRSQIIFGCSILAGFILGPLFSGIMMSLLNGNDAWRYMNIIWLFISVLLLFTLLLIHEPNQLCDTDQCNCFAMEQTKVTRQPSSRELSFRSSTIIFKYRDITLNLFCEFVLGFTAILIFGYTSFIFSTIIHTDYTQIVIVTLSIIAVAFLFDLVLLNRVLLLCSQRITSTVTFSCLSILCITIGTLVAYRTTSALLYTSLICITVIFVEILNRMVRSNAILNTPENKRVHVITLSIIARTIGSIVISSFAFQINPCFPFFICSSLSVLSAVNCYKYYKE